MLALVYQWRVAAVLCAAAVTACTVADSLHVDPAAISATAYSPAVPTLCQSSLGSYALPKSFLKVVVERIGEGPPQIAAPTTIVRADKSLVFCLDHIVDPLADDEIRIIKSSGQMDPSYAKDETPTQGELVGSQYLVGTEIKNNKDYGSQLLQWVVSNTVDQSEYIAKVLVRTAFIALSGKSGFTPLSRELPAKGDTPPKSIVVAFEYDPFDPEQSAIHNARLRELGYCIVLESFTFDTRRMTPEQYCSAPRYESFPFDEAYARYRSGPPPRVAGIAYRPRINYALSIYKNDNPKGRGRWRLDRQQRVAFENIAPIVSIGLNRSIFAARRVALKFNLGTLEAMCLVKTSELLSAVQVPYEIAKSIVALPTQIFEVKIGNIKDNIDLLNAEKAVVTAQAEYLEYLSDVSKKTAAEAADTASPLEANKLPKPAQAITTLGFQQATTESLQSSVLKQICRSAPSAIGVPPP